MGTIGKAYSETWKKKIDVHAKVGKSSKELPSTGHFCVPVPYNLESARKHRVSYPFHPSMHQSDIIGGGNSHVNSCFELCLKSSFFVSLIWILVLNADPNPDPGGKKNADRDPKNCF